jgi:hypothetical protein
MERSARVALNSEVVPVFVTLIRCSSCDFALRSILETEYDVQESIHALKSEAKSVFAFRFQRRDTGTAHLFPRPSQEICKCVSGLKPIGELSRSKVKKVKWASVPYW